MYKIISRIRDIAVNENITLTALERAIGASKGVLSRALANGTDIQSKWIEAVVENYPQYSTRWLLTGDGEMMRQTHRPNAIKAPEKLISTYKSSEMHVGGFIESSKKSVERSPWSPKQRSVVFQVNISAYRRMMYSHTI